MLGAAAANPVPFCVGTNHDENLLFLAFDPNLAAATVDQWVAFTERELGDRAAEARDEERVVHSRLHFVTGGKGFRMVAKGGQAHGAVLRHVPRRQQADAAYAEARALLIESFIGEAID